MRFLLSVAILLLLAANVSGSVKVAGCPDARSAEELRKGTVGLLVAGNESCSGTLIAPRVVLTTAQCVGSHKPEDLRFTLHPEGLVRRATFARAKAVYFHPRYPAKLREAPPAADVAVVALADIGYGAKPPVYYDVVAKAETIPAGAPGFLIGYGLNPDGSRSGRRPRKIRFRGTRDAPLSESEMVPEGILRFARGDEGELPCTGDSGGPVLRFADGETRILGLHAISALSNLRDARGQWLPMSPAERCRRSDEALATNLALYANWIVAIRDEIGGRIPCKR